MPVYEFRCRKCGTRYEVTCHWDEREKHAVCPQCGSTKSDPVVTSFACEPPKRY
jgi:putative FmdB family regulatory protein